MIDDPQAAWPSHEAYVKCMEKKMESENDDFDTKPVVIRRGEKRYSLLRWIPVSERLPDEGELVSVWISGGSRAVPAKREGSGWRLDYGGFLSDSGTGVTRWMPLPGPPLEKEA